MTINECVNEALELGRLRRELERQKIRMETIREVSNIVQAIENLIAQCESELFEGLKGMMKDNLEFAKEKLRELIHG